MMLSTRQIKAQLVTQLIDALHAEARNKGFTCAAINDQGFRRINRMTKVQVQNELDRISGVKQLSDMPANHVCILLN